MKTAVKSATAKMDPKDRRQSSLIEEWRRLDLVAAGKGRKNSVTSWARLKAVACPCGRCRKQLVTPLFHSQDATIDPVSAAEIVKRWNAFDLVFDDYTVYCALSKRAKRSTNALHVGHVLDAMARILKEAT